jgi:hypothetical protein
MEVKEQKALVPDTSQRKSPPRKEKPKQLSPSASTPANKDIKTEKREEPVETRTIDND